MSAPRHQVEETIRQLAVEVQAQVANHNPDGAVKYSEALRDACAALEHLIDSENNDA